MKNISIPIAFFLLGIFPGLTRAQPLLSLATGEISFVSDAPLELIKASTTDFKILVDTSESEFAIRIPIAGFVGFNSPLQQEHFYENYMETDKYSSAVFSGKILDPLTFRPDTFRVTVKGNLNIHGKSAMRIMEVNCFWETPERLSIESAFKVPLADHGIEIPRIVYQKIAEEIAVQISAKLIFRDE